MARQSADPERARAVIGFICADSDGIERFVARGDEFSASDPPVLAHPSYFLPAGASAWELRDGERRVVSTSSPAHGVAD